METLQTSITQYKNSAYFNWTQPSGDMSSKLVLNCQPFALYLQENIEDLFPMMLLFAFECFDQ